MRRAAYVHMASPRSRSEDRAEIFERADALVIVVADGAGGVTGGATASDALVEMARAVAQNTALDVCDAGLWGALFGEVDAALAKKMAGETTGIVLVLGSHGLVGVSAGDSEAWVVGLTGLDDLTQRQKRARLGSGRAAPVSFSRPRLDGTLIVGTDGLFKYATSEQIASVVRDSEVATAPERLTALVRLPSGRLHDDVAIVAVAGT